MGHTPVQYFTGPHRNIRNCESYCCPQRREWFSGHKQQQQEQIFEPHTLKLAELSRWRTGLMCCFPPSTEGTRSKKQHKKANIWASVLWFRLSLHTIQSQTQRTANFQAKVLFLREVPAGVTGHTHRFPNADEKDPTLLCELFQTFEHGKLWHYSINQQLAQNGSPHW